MICAFQRDYPNIDFEILMGDYPEIEQWILQGRADFGFLHLPTRPELAVTELARDELMVVLPEEHPLARLEKFRWRPWRSSPSSCWTRRATGTGR